MSDKKLFNEYDTANDIGYHEQNIFKKSIKEQVNRLFKQGYPSSEIEYLLNNELKAIIAENTIIRTKEKIKKLRK